MPWSRLFPIPIPARFDRQLRADQRADAGGERGFMEARRAGDAVAIEQRDRRVAEHGRAIDEHFRQRRGAQKTEGGGSVKLDVHGQARVHRDTEDTETSSTGSLRLGSSLIDHAFKKPLAHFAFDH